MKKLFLFILGWLPLSSFAQDSLNVMFYNLYRFPVNSPANREYLLQHIISYAQPDLLMACEIVNEDGADRILRTAFQNLPDSFARPEFVYSASAAGDPLQQTVFYNTRKLLLTAQETLLTDVRDINHYTFILNQSGSGTDSVFLDAFVAHLKSSDGTVNQNKRLAMADTFIKALEKVPPDHHVLFAGDFNFYNSSEPAYREILDSTHAITMTDPLNAPGNWHDNAVYAAIHTQATRKTLDGFGLGGASGGLDDRFDFILISANCYADNELQYTEHSYKAFGNNGNCFNRGINNDSCAGIYPLTLRQILFQMSDHTPVILQLRTGKSFPAAIPDREKTAAVRFTEGNVVHNRLSIRINIPRSAFNHRLFIYDCLGKIQKTVILHNPAALLQINTGDLASGLYFIRVGGASWKFVKQ